MTKKQIAAASARMVSFFLYLPADIKDDVRAHARNSGRSIGEVIRQWIEEGLSSVAERKGKQVDPRSEIRLLAARIERDAARIADLAGDADVSQGCDIRVRNVTGGRGRTKR